MDLRMPNMDGLTAIENLHTEQPEIAVVILTTFNEDELMFRGLQAGARGYLLKDTDRATCSTPSGPRPVVKHCSSRRSWHAFWRSQIESP